MNFGSKILDYKEEIIKDLEQLIKIPSCASESIDGMPFGEQSAAALNWILNRAEEMGLSTKNVGNYAGHAEYGTGKELAGVLTHVDVVPAGEGWSTDPFELTLKDGKMFGRGVADDKGSAIVALYCLKALKDNNVNGKRMIRAIFGAGEECGMDDMEVYFSNEKLPDIAFTPDSDYGICNREKGILQLEIMDKTNDGTVLNEFHAGKVVNAVPDKAYVLLDCTENEDHQLQRLADAKKGDYEFRYTIDGMMIISKGIASHAAYPEKGFNAATNLIKLLASNFGYDVLGKLCSFINTSIGTDIYGEKLGIKCSDEYSGDLTLNVGTVDIGSNYAKMKLDIRYPVTADGKEILNKIMEKASENGLIVNMLNHQEPLFIKEDAEIISILNNAYKSIMNKDADIYYTGGGTYARSLEGRGVAFGPVFQGEEPRLHNADENLSLDKLMLHAQICLEAMYRMITE